MRRIFKTFIHLTAVQKLTFFAELLTLGNSQRIIRLPANNAGIVLAAARLCPRPPHRLTEKDIWNRAACAGKWSRACPCRCADNAGLPLLENVFIKIVGGGVRDTEF